MSWRLRRLGRSKVRSASLVRVLSDGKIPRARCVTDELSAMLREGAGLLKTRRDSSLALRMVECREHHMCLRMGYGDADRG